MLISSRLRALTAACVVAGGLTVGVAPAAQALPPVTWIGGVNDLWSEPTNWDSGSVPGPLDDVVFPPVVSRTNVENDLPGGAVFRSIRFTGAGYVVHGNSVDLISDLTVYHGSGTTTLDVPVSLDNGNVYVLGGATLDVDGTISAQTAALNVDGGGTLQVDGTTTNPLILANSSRLTGSGTLNGAGISATGAPTISPGRAGGTGNLGYAATSGLTLPTSSTLHVDIDGPTAGSGYDRLTLSSGSALFNPNGATLDVDLGYVPAINTSFQIVSQVFASPITGRFNGLSQFGSFTTQGVTFSIGYFNSGVVLTVIAVDVPSGTVTVDDTDLLAGETSTVTVAFDEPVTGFDNSDLNVANGTLTPVSTSDGGATWTATLTPAPSVDDASNVITLDNAGVTNAGGHAGVGTTSSNNYAVSTVRPTAVLITISDTSLRIGETALVTITFSEAVTGFTVAHLNAANATVSGLSTSDGGITWTATLTPSASTTDATNLITLDVTGVQDSVGNAGTGTTTSTNYAIDTRAPTATVVLADSALGIGETSLVTITFSEPVIGFDLADLNPANGTLSGLATADNITYTATFTPSAAINDATNIITLNAGGVIDTAGNGNSAASSNNYVIDSTRPTATIVVADADLRAGETSLVTTTFSEPVVGFDNADLSVDNGTLSAVSSSDGGVTWTATLTPTPSTTDASNVVTLANAGVTDVAGNAGTGTTSSGNYAVDTAPIVAPDRVPPASDASGPAYSRSATWEITYDAADETSGIGSVDLYVQAPGETTYTKVATDSADQDGRFTYTGTADGTYRFHTIATDRAGNTEPAPGSADGTTVLDSHAPSSQGAGPSVAGASTWTITYDATDATSGIGSVDLYVRAPGESTYAKVATDSADLDGRFTYTGTADGTYRFHTIATDRAGNTETAPAESDLVTVLDTRAPVLRAVGRAPLSFGLSQGRPVALRFRVDETVSVTFRIVKRGTAIRTFETRSGGPGVLEQLWRGGTDAGRRVEPGRYRVVVTVEDAAGNRTRASAPLRVRR